MGSEMCIRDSHQSGGGMNGFNTDEMLKKLGKLDPREFSPGAAPQGENNG